jgi:hypothetical protein
VLSRSILAKESLVVHGVIDFFLFLVFLCLGSRSWIPNVGLLFDLVLGLRCRGMNLYLSPLVNRSLSLIEW